MEQRSRLRRSRPTGGRRGLVGYPAEGAGRRILTLAGLFAAGLAVASLVAGSNRPANAAPVGSAAVRLATRPGPAFAQPKPAANTGPTSPSGSPSATTTVPQRSSVQGITPASQPTTTALAANAGTGLRTTIGTRGEPQIVRVGSSLREVDPNNPSQFLKGSFRFTGVDAYELTTDWAVNYGCGSDLSDSDMSALLQSLGANAVVRTWFFQALATNKYTGQVDWTGLDRVVRLASQAGVHLIVTLGNQDGTCDDSVWKDPVWYSSGYLRAMPHRISFSQWTSTVVARYKDAPAILAWEPMNEPRPDTCTDSRDCWDHRVCPSSDLARGALRSFFDSVGAEIRAIDRNHLISDGAPPVESCGALTWNDLQYLDSSMGIDLMSFHDYTGTAPLAPASAADYSQIASAIHKPIFAGENGGVNAIPTGNGGGGCLSLANRANGYGPKIAAEFASMAAFTGWLFWNAGPPPVSAADNASCLYGTWRGDPLLNVLAQEGVAARAG